MTKEEIRRFVSTFVKTPQEKWDKIEACWNRSLLVGWITLLHSVAIFKGVLVWMVFLDGFIVFFFMFFYVFMAKDK